MSARSADSDSEPPTAATWAPLLGARATFEVASWRSAALDDVCVEIEHALGVKFVASHDKVYEGEPALACKMPACELRLSSWPSATPALQYFNFIGIPSEDLALALPPPETLSEAFAEQLRGTGGDWYAPHVNEILESGGVLGEKLLDADVVVSILAPRWLAWSGAEEKEIGRQLLTGIAELWIAAARRNSDPVAEMRRRRAEFEGWSKNVQPRSRFQVLGSYAIQEQLSTIENELDELRELTPVELAARPDTRKRVAEWRAVIDALAEPVKQTRLETIGRQRAKIGTLLDQLVASLHTD